LLVEIARPGASDALDTYETAKDHGTAAANLGLLYVDVHFQPRKLGTETEKGPT
jgi:hypothetical protein